MSFIARLVSQPGKIIFSHTNLNDIGVIEKNNGYKNDQIVMRTASIDKFEVMDLSYPTGGGVWTKGRGKGLMVKLSQPGTKNNINR